MGKRLNYHVFLVDNRILYVEHSKDAARNCCISFPHELTKAAGQGLHTGRKFLALLYTNSEMLENVKEAILFVIVSKRMKYLGLHLP